MKQTTKSRVLSLLLVLAMVFSMLPASVFAADATATYTKVTTAPTDWTGEYLLVYESGKLAFDGSLESPDVVNNYVSTTISNNSITMSDHSTAIYIEAVTGGYVLKSSSGLYLYHSSDANKLSSTENKDTAAKYPLTISVTSSGTDLALSCGPHMSFNNSSDQMRFRYYKSSSYSNQQPIALYKLDDSSSTEPPPAETTAPTETIAPAVTVSPISDALAASEGSFTVKGVVTLVDGSNIYLQDETGAICVRMASAPSDIALGDTIIGTGSKTSYYGLPQLGSGTYEKSEGLTLSAKETTIGALAAADICTYVKLTGLEVTEVYDNNGQSSAPNITVTDGTNTIQLYKAVTSKTDGTWDIAVGDKVEITAAVGIYNTTYQLRNTLATEITVVADDSGETADPTTPEEVNPVIADGTYVIWEYANDKAMTALAESYSYGYIKTKDVILVGSKLYNAGETEAFTIKNISGGQFTIQDSYGRYLYMSGSYNSFNVSATEPSAGHLWTAVHNDDGTYAITNVEKSKTISYDTAYGSYGAYAEPTDAQLTALTLTPAADLASDPLTPLSISDGDYALWVGGEYNMALSSVYSGYYNGGVAVTETDGKLTGCTTAEIWTISTNSNGTISISFGGQKLGMADSYSSMTLGAAHNKWILEDAGNGKFYVKNTVRECYIEWYAGKSNWSGYEYIGSGSEDMFAITFTPAEDVVIPVSSLPSAGDEIMIYNVSAEGVLGAENDTQSIENVSATVTDGTVTAQNGGVVFKVEISDGYYRFYNETYGYLCSNGTGNNAFYSLEASEDADWRLEELGDGFKMLSRTAKYNGTYAQYLEYYADSYKTYSFYATNKDGSAADTTIYEFHFYPCANKSLTEGIVNQPDVVFGTVYPAYVGMDYTYTFSMDTVFGVKELKVTNSTLEKEYEYTLEGDTYTVIVPAEDIDAIVAKLAEQGISQPILSLSFSGTDNKDVSFGNGSAIDIKDEPAIGQVTPAANEQTMDDKRPVISAEITNAGDNPTVTMTVNGEAVTAEYADGIVSYTPAEELADGRTTVTLTVKRADGKEVSKTWSFTVGEAQYQLYFGQLHSHTTYSDGSGSLESALEYIANLPESANVDFVAFTDHSNYFDSSSAANPEGALYDMSLATSDSQKLWSEYKNAIADFNASHSDVIAIAGFEMTWSGGPGHINTFNTEGIVSRNNTTLNNKTSDAGMKAYYSLLSQPEGADSISQFNHPGSTFGTFTDFAYWDALIDTRIQLVEVGNGEGQIGAGGYYPSYEYYTMALDKGWHVAPTNNQDNHKGKWGNANDARDVILTDDFSEEGIYQAIRDMRMYATEDKNLEIGYSVNGLMLGSSITEVPEKLNFEITVYDPDASDSISKVELIVNSGKVAYTWDDPADLSDGALEATLDPTYSYYYVRVTEGDGDLAVTAPVWVGESLKLGISAVETTTSTPVTGEELTITTTLFNSESADATVKSLTYTTEGSKVIGTDTTGYTIPGSGTATVEFNYTPTSAKLTTVTVTAVVDLEGTEYTFTMDIALDVRDASKLVYIGIDASHYNEYVNGNYKDSMGNFSELAAQYGVRTVTLYESEDLIEACKNDKYKALILTAPSRRSAEAQASDPLKVYTEEELAAINEFNREGGTVILAGWSDHYENYPAVDSIANMQAQEHMAATQNAILEMLGSSLRIGDDATYDDDYNGGQAYRLYFNTYGDSFLTDGVEVDPEHPHDRLYTEVFSHYGGASVYTVDGTLPSTVAPVVFGHTGTYSVDVDKDGLGGDSMPKYEYAEGDSRLMIMATEQIGNQGLIIVSGAAFMSNFEVQATIEDSGSEKNYSNYKICENLLAYINPVSVTPIEEVRAQTEVGYKYTIEGTVTSNASGYDKDTAFFDCIYVQDETGGICCFPVAGNYKIGDKVRITGTTEFYQGEPELQVTSIEVIGSSDPIESTVVTASEINDRSAEGKLVTLSGRVISFELANGLVQTIMVADENGDTARVFIDGYITTAEDVKDLEVGCGITVTGLASYDDTFNAPDGPFPRIRVRDRADVVCTEHIHAFEEAVVKPTCTAEGYTEYVCEDCGYSYRDSFVPANGHTTVSEVTAPTHDRMGYTVTSCENCDFSFVHTFVDAEEHEFAKEVTKEATCTAEGEWTFTCECGETYTQVIPVTGHNCTATVVAPECEKYGYTIYQCADCDFNYLSDPTEPTGHSYTGKYVGAGLMQYTCQCGHTYTDLHACPSAAYSDLDLNRWYHEATDFVLSEEIMIGTAEAVFAPNGNLTRGQMVTILYRLAGEPETAGAAPFTDVAETAYYADAVAWGYATGVVKGISATEFAPTQNVTRQQMATFLYRYAGSPEAQAGALNAFTDSADISAYALDAMNWIVGAGIINGTTPTTLSPKDSTTRVQAAAIVYRYLSAE